MAARDKALGHAQAAKGTLQVDVDGKKVKVKDVHVDLFGRLVCTVECKDLPVEANPFIFVNPPIIHNDEENLETAFSQMVRDAVRRWLSSQR